MALPPLANLTEFIAWEPGDVSNTERAAAILAAASALIRAHTGRVWVDASGEIEAGVTEVQRETVRSVCLQVTSRVYNNPLGSTQQSTGPFSRSVAAWAAQGLSLTDEDKAQLPVASGARPALWTQATTRCEDDLPDIYLDVAGSTESIPHAPRGYPW